MAILNSGLAKSSAAAGYEIDSSLRLNNSGYLYKTFATEGNRKTWTVSQWVKISAQAQGVTALSEIFGRYVSSDFLGIELRDGAHGSDDTKRWCFECFWNSGDASTQVIRSTAKYRDPSSWYHVVVVLDTTEGAAADRLKAYINNEEITAWEVDNRSTIALNEEMPINKTNSAHWVGGWNGTGGAGYVAEAYFIDGTALTPSSFAELDSDTNQWIPLDSDDVKDAVTFGTNGFYQKYNSTELAASFDDSSSSDHTITANGDATNERPQHHNVTANGDAHLIGPKVGTSLITSSVKADYLSVATVSGFDFGTSTNFTAEFWMNCGVQAASVACMIGSGNTGWGTGANLIRMSGSTGPGVEYFHYDGNGATAMLSSASNVNDRKWHLVSVVRSSTTWYLFIDGTLEDTWTGTNPSTNLAYNGSVYFGKNGWDGTNGEWLGDFGPIRISDTARYTASFDLPTDVWTNDSDTLFLLQNGTDGTQTFTDSSSETHTISVSGDMRWFAPKVGAGAMAMDGTGDYFALSGGGDDWAFGTGDFTVECWIKQKSSPETYEVIFDTRGSVSDTAGFIFGIKSDGAIYCYSNGMIPTSSTGVISANTWHHVALVRDGGEFEIFVDGTSVGTDSTARTFTTTSARIGADSYSAGEDFKGYMDRFRVSRIARYTSTFTPSTTAFTDDINTVLLLNADINQGTWAEDTSTGLAISTDSRMKFDGNGDELTCADSSDWNFGTDPFTLELWFNIDSTNEDQRFFGQYEDTNNRWYFGIHSADRYFQIYSKQGGTIEAFYTSANGTYNYNTWHHAAFVRDGTSVYLFVDGVSKTLTTVGGADIGTDAWGDDAAVLRIGQTGGGATEWLNGYADEIRISNTARYTSAFTPQTRGNPFTADANTKLLIHSDYTGGLGADSSGNYNNFTATNLVATDQMVDTPTNNFSTMNPLDNYYAGATFSEGNLKVATGQSGIYSFNTSTIKMPSGKWYWELLWLSGTGTPDWAHPGISSLVSSATNDWPGKAATSWSYSYDGQIWNNNSGASYGDTFTVGVIIGVAVDLTNNKLYFSKNGTWQNSGVPTSGATGTGAVSITAGDYFAVLGDSDGDSCTFIANFGADSSFSNEKTAQGNQDSNGVGDFFYEPPSGFLAICEDNLPAPDIALPGDNFNTVKYDGNSSTNVITTGMAPDWVWLKSTTTTYWNQLYDSVRGPNLALYSNENEDEYVDDDALMSFDTNGFTLGAEDGANNGSTSYVSWSWKAGGAPTADNSAGAGATPTAGSVKIDGSNLGSALAGTIAATKLSANTTAGFSIVKYEGSGVSGATVAHGLSQAPDMVIVKSLDADVDWAIYIGTGISDATDYWEFNTNTVGATGAYWNDTAPTASVFSIGNSAQVNTSGDNYIAYCFHEVEGYSKIGNYVGNGNVDGTFIYTGFRPAYFLTKWFSSGEEWEIQDDKRPGYNQTTLTLYAGDNNAEEGGFGMDFVSNGIKWRAYASGGNYGSREYAYIAFASHPFKTANAR